MRVLVTRTRADGERTAARLAGAGHHPLLAPVIEIVARRAPMPEGPFAGVIATSGHALCGLDDLPPALRDAPWLVVGERLQRRLALWGVAPRVVAPDAATLEVELCALHPFPTALLYLAGRDRKPDLEQSLVRHGHRLTIVETYEARAVSVLDSVAATALQGGAVDAVLHFSRRSAALFTRSVNAAGLARQAAQLQHLAISPDAAEPLRGEGWTVLVAPTPDERSLLGMIAHDV